MNSLGINRAAHVREAPWLNRMLEPLRERITMADILGVIGAMLALVLLLALHDPWNIRLPLYLVATIWVILRPRVALYLLPLAVPWGSLDYITLGSLRFDSADVLVALLLAAWLMSFALPGNRALASDDVLQRSAWPSIADPRDRVPQPLPFYLVLATLGLLLAMLLSMAVAISISASLKEIVKWLEFLAILLVAAQYIRTRRQVWTIIVMLCLGAVSQALYGFFQEFFNIGPQSFVRDNTLRVYGTFDQPNPFAGYINIVLSISLAMALLGRNWTTRILAGLVTIALAAVEYLTQSRGGWIAMGTAAIFVLVMGIPHIRAATRVLLIAVLGSIGAFLGGLLPTTVFAPILDYVGVTGISLEQPTVHQFATAERIAHWLAGLHMFFDHPWLGVGIGNYEAAYPKYFITIFTVPLGHAHNYFINVAAEMGAVGLVAYTLFLLAVFFAGAHAYRTISRQYKEVRAQRAARPEVATPVGTRNKLRLLLQPFKLAQLYRRPGAFENAGILMNDRALAIGILAALITILMHNMVDDLYVHGIVSLMALLIAILIRLEELKLPAPGQ